MNLYILYETNPCCDKADRVLLVGVFDSEEKALENAKKLKHTYIEEVELNIFYEDGV